MLRLTDLQKDMLVDGIEPGHAVRIVSVSPEGEDAVTVVYRVSDDALRDRILFRSAEPKLKAAEQGRPWALDGDPNHFRLAAEAFRIHLAHLFDPLMAIHTSNVEPLPHQITAVYDSMLPKQPLRFVLADDPGAGKTIMAGLLIRELMVRGDLERCLVVAPGSLVDQWQDELDQKFNLYFEIFSRDMVESTASGNPFAEKDLLICRIDQLARAEDLQEKVEAAGQWDLVIVDEAHKMSASYFNNELKRTKRYQLGELLGQGNITRHFLLMTATPHSGIEENFQAFLALVDGDRFYGKYRDGVHQVKTSDIMRRVIKEELVKFDGTPLFPERIADTVNYPLSDREAALYHSVTDYVKTQMNRAQNLDGKRRGTVGFALTILQRRLASSPEAIYQSLQRRQKRMEHKLEEAKLTKRGLSALGNLPEMDDDDLDEVYDDLSCEDVEKLEDQVIDEATAAQTIEELQAEIVCLKDLVEKAAEVRAAGEDLKWQELSSLLQDNPAMKDAQSNRRKIIIFTEHKDTLNYLYDRIGSLLGNQDAIELIHGGVKREDRRKAVEKFTNYGDCTVLLATDAAGEGVNLQVAHLMINYDLPWNPNRIEQRFGRIHRIGQTEVCRLWNLVANETREGAVFQRLLDKIKQERESLGGKVFDVLGRVFEQQSLKDLLLEAIRYGDDPKVKAKLETRVDEAMDHTHIKELIDREAIGAEHLSTARVFELKEQMEKAEAQRLQPFFIRSFFEEAFSRFEGQLRDREEKRYEINHVPAVVRQRDRQIGGGAPVLERYQRVCFEKSRVRVTGKPMATLLAPGHPLIDATVDLVMESHRTLLKQGTVFVDPNNEGETPRMLFIINHAVKDGMEDKNGQQRTISQKLQYVLLDPEGNAQAGGPAPYLDYNPLPENCRELAEEIIREHWLDADMESKAKSFASTHMVPQHFEEVESRRLKAVDATLEAVHARLTVEINRLTHRYQQLLLDVEAGKQPRMQPENVRRTAETLTARLEQRTKDLEAQRNVIPAPPHIIGGALIIPQGLLNKKRGQTPAAEQTVDAQAKAEVERIAMEAVAEYERSQGYTPNDVSKENCGWDITSVDDKGNCRFIEVKGRHKDATTVTVSKNEMLVGFNKRDSGWYLALVLVDGETVDGPHYITAPFDREPGWAETSVNLDISALRQQAQPQ